MSRLQNHVRDPLHVFKGQDENEPVEIFARVHWFFSVRLFTLYVLALAGPGALLLLLAFFNLSFESRFVRDVLLFLYCLYALFCTASFFVRWMKMYLDYIIVTRVRIVDVNTKRIFSVSSAETLISEVVDVSVTSRGYIANKLHFGTLTIQTKATKGLFQQQHVPNAEAVRSRIVTLCEEHEKDTQTAAFQAAFQAMGSEGITVKAPEEGLAVRPVHEETAPPKDRRDPNAPPAAGIDRRDADRRGPEPDRRGGDDGLS